MSSGKKVKVKVNNSGTETNRLGSGEGIQLPLIWLNPWYLSKGVNIGICCGEK